MKSGDKIRIFDTWDGVIKKVRDDKFFLVEYRILDVKYRADVLKTDCKLLGPSRGRHE